MARRWGAQRVDPPPGELTAPSRVENIVTIVGVGAITG